MTNRDYHARPEISHSQIEVFRRSRKEYHARFVARTLETAPTPSMLLGTTVHALVLDPEAFGTELVVAPDVDRRTKAGKEQYEAWKATVPSSAAVITEAMLNEARHIANAIYDSVDEMNLFRDRDGCEVPMIWTDHNGANLRAKLDFVDYSRDLIVDIKTCQASTPRAFAYAAAKLGYVRQAEWYSRGYMATQGRIPTFVFVAVQTSEPYEVGLYQFSEAEIRNAAGQNDMVLQSLMYCRKHDDWRGVHENEVVELSLPRYAAYDDEYLTF
jgi:exodeoxyribonuclease VIII